MSTMSSETRTPPVTIVQFSQNSGSGGATCVGRKTPWRERRYAPYVITPATRNLRSTRKGTTQPARQRTPIGGKKNDEDPMAKELVKKTWRVCRVSPLYKLSHKTRDLRQYSRVLSSHLEVENGKGLEVRLEGEAADLAVFSVLKGLKKSDGDSEAIKIDLKQKSKNGAKDPVVVLTAILCCVNGCERTLQKVSEPFTLLPVMLVKGPVALGRCLNQWLECQFDCVIHPVVFPPVVLSWMVAMWAGSKLEKGSRSVELQYRVPPEVKGLTYITLDIDSDDCKKLWECVHSSSEDSFHENEVVSFIKAIESHFYHHFKVNISAMPLSRVGTSIAYIGSEGRLKIFSPDHVHQVMSHVTEIIMERTLSLH